MAQVIRSSSKPPSRFVKLTVLVGISISVLLMLGAVWAFMYRGEQKVYLALEHQGTRYLHSAFARMPSLEHMMATQFSVLNSGDELFLRVSELARILPATGNDLIRTDTEQAGYNGYFVERTDNRFALKSVTGAIVNGVQETVFATTGKTPDGRPWKIAYGSSMANGFRAIENCEERFFFEVFSVVPGESRMTPVKSVVVSVSKLTELTGATFELEAESGTLVVRPGGVK